MTFYKNECFSNLLYSSFDHSIQCLCLCKYYKQFVYCIRAGKFFLKSMQESNVTVLSVRQEVGVKQ
jgi:hypothetical protein